MFFQEVIEKIMDCDIPSWRKKAFDAGDKENREMLLSSIGGVLLSPAVLVNFTDIV